VSSSFNVEVVGKCFLIRKYSAAYGYHRKYPQKLPCQSVKSRFATLDQWFAPSGKDCLTGCPIVIESETGKLTAQRQKHIAAPVSEIHLAGMGGRHGE
jgi:hypothetical protein